MTTDSRTLAEAERIHHAWNDAPAARNVEATTAPCAEDATIESPLVRYLLGSDARDTRPSARSNKHQPEEQRTHPNPLLTDGHSDDVGYPRGTGAFSNSE